MDAVFEEMSAATDAALERELPARERLLIDLVADVCLGTLGEPYALHVRTAAAHGISGDELRELLRFIAYDSGYQAAALAMARLPEIEQEYGLPAPAGVGHEVDAAGTGSPIPQQVREEVRALDAPFAAYMDLQSRMRAGMSQLSVRERAFCTITVDVLYQTLTVSLRTHVGRALSAGASPGEVAAVVRYVAKYGMTRGWAAMIAVKEILEP